MERREGRTGLRIALAALIAGAAVALAACGGGSKQDAGDPTGTFKVDRSKKPNTIDMIPSVKAKKRPSSPAIIEVIGDSMTFCANLETNQRPKDFTSTAENKNFVVVYKRQK